MLFLALLIAILLQIPLLEMSLDSSVLYPKGHPPFQQSPRQKPLSHRDMRLLGKLREAQQEEELEYRRLTPLPFASALLLSNAFASLRVSLGRARSLRSTPPLPVFSFLKVFVLFNKLRLRIALNFQSI